MLLMMLFFNFMKASLTVPKKITFKYNTIWFFSMMKKRFVFSILPAIIALLLLSTGAVTGEKVCGMDPNSYLGYGQINLSGILYSCNNVADGLCPEDYEDANNPEIFGNCSSCSDPDCTGTLTGYVYNAFNIPLDRSIVKSNPIKWNQSAPLIDNSTLTDATGKFTLKTVTGRYYFSATKSSYDTELKEIAVLRNKVTTADFYLLNGTCHEDCTNSYGRCNANCDGQIFYGTSSCNFYNDTIMELCNNRMLGTSVYIRQYNSTHAYFVDCCEGLPYIKYFSELSVETNKIKDLAKIEKIAKYNDVPVKVIIAYWTPVTEQ